MSYAKLYLERSTTWQSLNVELIRVLKNVKEEEQ